PSRPAQQALWNLLVLISSSFLTVTTMRPKHSSIQSPQSVSQTLTGNRRAEYLSPQQLKQEFLGRIVNAASAVPAEEMTARLYEQILSENGLKERIKIPFAFLPGPLEGAIGDDLQSAPEPMIAVLEEELDRDEVQLALLHLLINMEGMFRIPAPILTRAIEKIEANAPKLFHALPTDEVRAYLLGLANLAGSHQLPPLALVVRHAARTYANVVFQDTSEEVRLSLHAAAAFGNTDEWYRFLGEWLQWLARDLAEPKQAQVLLNWLDGLCAIDRRLKGSTGRARASARLLLGV
ncbi:MAG: hypothetical protein AAF559_08575, partial [Pseudomonadota bacterium]